MAAPMQRTVDLGCVLGVPMRAELGGVLLLLGVNGALATVLCRVARPDWPLWTLALVALATTALLQLSAVVHELAHLAVARRLGQPVGALVLNHVGGYVLVDARDAAQPHARAVALYVAAGPAATGLLWALLVLAGEALRPTSPELALVCAVAGALNGALLALNLMPVEPLDGGRLLRLATRAWRGEGALFAERG